MKISAYRVGDRVPWCEGCYGEVIAKTGGTLIIRTDDGIDRQTSEENTMKVEVTLQERGINWT